jgi:hypothetical protein
MGSLAGLAGVGRLAGVVLGLCLLVGLVARPASAQPVPGPVRVLPSMAGGTTSDVILDRQLIPAAELMREFVANPGYCKSLLSGRAQAGGKPNSGRSAAASTDQQAALALQTILAQTPRSNHQRAIALLAQRCTRRR